MTTEGDLPFALIRWIKRQQEEAEQHRLATNARNWREDEQFLRYLSFLAREWGRLKTRDRQIVASFMAWRKNGRNYTPNQRSTMAALLMKYDLVEELEPFGA
jgi:hypothetical protein